MFLSHNSRDKPAVERLAERLKRQGLEPWLDKWCLTPGGNWQNELLGGIQASKACAFFLGPHGEGAWAREELHVALDRAAKDSEFRLFLVLLPGVEEPFNTTRLPPFLSTRTWVDLRKGVEDTRSFQTLIHAIKGIPLGPEVAIEPRDDVCPYRGLESFDEEHAEYFFGRDAETQRLLEKLKTNRFLAVLGSSGNGKSSLVRAGLIPALRKGGLPGSERWPIRILTPGAHPLEALAAQIVRLEPDQRMHQVLDQLAADPRALHLGVSLAMADTVPTARVVWVIDQCEELFILCQDEVERNQFIDNLLYAATVPDGRCVMILTMRADFYPRCAAHAEFCNQVSTHQFLVSPMDREGLRQCIEEPARRVGLEFEQGLVNTILDDVGSQPGALPLLEHALLELWERRRGYMLTLEGYEEAGRVQGAIAKRADTLYSSLTPEQQAIARRLMLRLTHPGEGTEDTRRRASFRELVTHPGEAAAVEAVVHEFANARLITVSGHDDAGDSIVDIAHEAVIRSWPRLRAWLDEDRTALRIQYRLAEAAAEWERLHREDDLLYRGARLAEAIEWSERYPDVPNRIEQEFIQAGVAHRDREVAQREQQRLARERMRQRFTALLGIGLMVALVLGGVALLQWQSAERERHIAEEERAVAVRAQAQAEQERKAALARQIAAQAEVLRNGRAASLAQAVALATESLRRLPSSTAEQTLRRALALLSRPVSRMTHEDYVQAVAFSPDGRFVATASNDRTARLWEATRGREVARLVHDEGVQAVAFSPDGRFVATASEDRTARLWEAASGAELARFAHGDFVNAVAFSPDGRLLATASDDGFARIWEVATSQMLAHLPHGARVVSLAFGPDARLLATVSADRTARVWNTELGEELSRVTHARAILRVAFSPDGRQIATASEDASARLWDAATGEELARFDHTREVTRIAFSPDGRLLATGSYDATARVWSVATRREQTRLTHETALNAVAFSSDGRYLATASADATARVWDPTTGQELSRMPHEKAVWTLAFSPNGRYLATGAIDGSAQVWETTIRRETAQLAHGAEAVAVAFSPQGDRVATASADRTARIWDAASGRELARLPHDDGVLTLAYSPEGQQLATGARDRLVRIWDATTGQETLRLTHGRDVVRVAFSPDGRRLASASDDGTARIWDPATGQELARITHAREVTRAVFSPDGRYLATGSDDNTAVLYDVETSREVARLPHGEGAVRDLAFSPDGRLLATAALDRTVRLWDVATQQEVGRLSLGDFPLTVAFSASGQYLATATTGGVARTWRVVDRQELPARAHDDAFVYAAVFSPDDRYLATVGRDRTARLWDLISGAELARFTHERDVVRATFSPDGRQLATASIDRTVRLWRAEPENLPSEACARLTRNLTPEEWRQYVGDEPYRSTCDSMTNQQ